MEGWLTWTERLLGCWVHNVTLNFDRTHDLDIGFLSLNFTIAVFQEWIAWLIWNDRDMNQQNDAYPVWSLPLTLPLDFKVKFWK